jgi:hypothetical protein
MDNMHGPSSGEPQDFWPTQEMGPRLVGPGQGWDQASQPAAAPAAPAPPPPPASPRRHRAVWWGAGIALVAMLAGGGLAAAELSSSSSPAPTGQAAELNTLLNSSSSPTSGTVLSSGSASFASPACLTRAAKLGAEGHTVAAGIVLRFCRHRLLRLRLLGGEHGEVTFNSKTGPLTLAFERGVIQSVSSSGVVVQAKDGTTWTWTLEGNTVIRHDGQRVTDASLSDGERVFAAGPVVGSSYDAKLIVVGANASPAPSPSPSASGS